VKPSREGVADEVRMGESDVEDTLTDAQELAVMPISA
jgi:hypothetical protein